MHLINLSLNQAGNSISILRQIRDEVNDYTSANRSKVTGSYVNAILSHSCSTILNTDFILFATICI